MGFLGPTQLTFAKNQLKKPLISLRHRLCCHCTSAAQSKWLAPKGFIIHPHVAKYCLRKEPFSKFISVHASFISSFFYMVFERPAGPSRFCFAFQILLEISIGMGRGMVLGFFNFLGESQDVLLIRSVPSTGARSEEHP